MAYNPRRIDPLDLQPRKAIGVALPFSGAAVFNSTYQSKDAIKNNLINFFLTDKNERILNLGFGAGLRNLLFENLTQEKINELKLTIVTNLQVYFPSVLVRELILEARPDEALVEFQLKYAIAETNIQDEVAINFEI